VTTIGAIGHRVVHGGAEFVAPTGSTTRSSHRIRAQVPLAPLHNPANLIGIEVATRCNPTVPQVAVFDTAFHAPCPRMPTATPCPEAFYREHGVRRYGFHGTSHAFVARRAGAAPRTARSRTWT
jgi:acetate kinase